MCALLLLHVSTAGRRHVTYCCGLQDLNKLQKQKAVLEASMQHTTQKLEAQVQDSTAKAEKADAALAEAVRLNTEYAARLEECQQSFMELEGESDKHCLLYTSDAADE